LQRKKLIYVTIVLLFLTFLPYFGTIQIFKNGGSNEFYSQEENIRSLQLSQDTPYIRYLGPDNHPIEGIDLKSYNDELFEIDFRLEDKTSNEWVIRVYAYLDFDIADTSLTNSENFQDGTNYKHFLPGVQPTPEELNPDLLFMGSDYIKILEDFEQFTTSEKDYTARKEFPGRIDEDLYFHVKVLYKQDILESDGWHSYYYYRTFYISWYWTRDFKHSNLKIIDDDILPPTFSDINILNSPIYDDYDEIEFEVLVEDDSGIADLYINFLGSDYFDEDDDHQIFIPNPSLPGEYSFNVIAIDGDTDRNNDQLRTTIYSSVVILDDDNNTPICGDVCIVNAPIYDDYDYVIFEFNVEDPSGISELYIEFMESKYYPNEDDQMLVPNPRIPGLYDFSAVAIDADMDHPGDQLNTTINSFFEVFDDDITPPEITICENEIGWDISIIDNDGIIDSKATGNYLLKDQYDNIIDTGIIEEEETNYHIDKKLICLKIGTYTLKVEAKNNDIEWQGDEETSTATKEITITLEDCFNYVIQQVEKLKNYINENLCYCCCCLKYFLIKGLNDVQDYLLNAYLLILQQDPINALNNLDCANKVICCLKSLVYCIMRWQYISYEIGNFIIQSLKDISNNIILLMDYTSDI